MSLTVVQTLPALEVGGVERGTLQVAAELVRRGHRSIVISAGGRMVDQLLQEGSEHIEWPIGKKNPLTLRYIKPLRRLLENESVDILHTRSRLPGWISYLAWKGMQENMRPKFITTVHGPYTVNAYSKVMTHGEQVIAISEFIKEYILSNYHDVDESKITVVHRGVKADEYPYGYQPDSEWLRQWRDEMPQTKDKFIITLPARVTRWKGQEDFLRIIAGLKKENVPAHGVIAGGPHPKKASFLDELKTLAAELQIDDHVSFIGHRDDIKNVMSVSDIVLSLAREPEAFGRTALEALALGVPVVAYDHGGASIVLSAIFPKGLVPPLDTSAAIATIKQLYRHSEPVPTTHPFTLDNMLTNTLAVYDKAIKT